MYAVIPIAILLLALRTSRGITDTMKKYEGAGVAGAQRQLSNYERGLL